MIFREVKYFAKREPANSILQTKGDHAIDFLHIRGCNRSYKFNGDVWATGTKILNVPKQLFQTHSAAKCFLSFRFGYVNGNRNPIYAGACEAPIIVAVQKQTICLQNKVFGWSCFRCRYRLDKITESRIQCRLHSTTNLKRSNAIDTSVEQFTQFI